MGKSHQQRERNYALSVIQMDRRDYYDGIYNEMSRRRQAGDISLDASDLRELVRSTAKKNILDCFR